MVTDISLQASHYIYWGIYGN